MSKILFVKPQADEYINVFKENSNQSQKQINGPSSGFDMINSQAK